MAIPQLRPLKLGNKGPPHGSRLEQRLRARVKTNTSLCPLVTWMKSGSSICCGSVEGHISSSLRNCKWKSSLQQLCTELVGGAAEESLFCLPDKKTGLLHFPEYQKAYAAVPQGKRPSDGSQSIAEAIVTQLLIDSLANARHVLLTEVQGLLHGEAAAVL